VNIQGYFQMYFAGNLQHSQKTQNIYYTIDIFHPKNLIKNNFKMKLGEMVRK
jgi:hypothetical protein